MEIISNLQPTTNDFDITFFEDLNLFDLNSNSEYVEKLLKYAKFILIREQVSTKIIAFLAYYENPSFSFISMLWTSRSYRRKGLGNSLINKLIELNHPEIRLEVKPDKALIRFYERRGFRPFLLRHSEKHVIMRRNVGVAIMQPYFLPSLQYFQLIGSVKKFVFLDDVNFRKKSFVNRNSIRNHWLSDERILLSIPLLNLSQNRTICDTYISKEIDWKNTFLKTVHHSYSKAPYFNDIYPILKSVIEKQNFSIASLSASLIKEICDYLDLKMEFFSTSDSFTSSKYLPAVERLAHITRELDSNHYINSEGGKDLYHKPQFTNLGLKLHFLQSNIDVQNISSDLKKFSFLDNLMRLSPLQIQNQLISYELI